MRLNTVKRIMIVSSALVFLESLLFAEFLAALIPAMDPTLSAGRIRIFVYVGMGALGIVTGVY